MEAPVASDAPTGASAPLVLVCKFRGGGSSGMYRLSLASLEPREIVNVIDEATGAVEAYEYAGEEPQVVNVSVYDNKGKFVGREAKIVAYYQIFTPRRDA